MLFVDDRTKRIHWAAGYYPQNGYEVTIACNVPEALRLMSRNEYDVISLDHDLNGHDFDDPESTGCGMEILRYIEKCGGWPEWRPSGNEIDHARTIPSKHPVIWVHTSNLFAGHLMIATANRLNLNAFWKPINQNKEYMQYDKEGLPI